jgi:hypothetical protein
MWCRERSPGKPMRTYFVSRLFGVLFVEYHRALRSVRPRFAHRSCQGEHLVWLGRLHLIYTPAHIVFG